MSTLSDTAACWNPRASLHPLTHSFFGGLLSAATSLILKHHHPGRDLSAVCLQRSEVSTQTQQGPPAAPCCQSLGCRGEARQGDGWISLCGGFQVRSLSNQTEVIIPTGGYFFKQGCRDAHLLVKHAVLSVCSAVRRIHRPQVGMRDRAGKQHLYLLFRKNKENIEIENSLRRGERVHFPCGWLTQAKTFYTNQFFYSSMQSETRLLRSHFLPRPHLEVRGVTLSTPTCVRAWRGALGCHARLHASCARECVHRSPAMMPTVPKGLLGLSR